MLQLWIPVVDASVMDDGKVYVNLWKAVISLYLSDALHRSSLVVYSTWPAPSD